MSKKGNSTATLSCNKGPLLIEKCFEGFHLLFCNIVSCFYMKLLLYDTVILSITQFVSLSLLWYSIGVSEAH